MTCPGAFAQSPFSSERRTQIESLLPRWQEVKSKASWTKNKFLSGIARDSKFNYQSFQSQIEEAWSLCENIERTERNRQGYLLGLLDKAFSKGKISQDEQIHRAGIVSKIFQIRMLFTYGSMMPRILDESTEESGQQGRLYAGPEWEGVLTQEEMKSLHGEYRTLSGFPPDLLDGKRS